MDHWKKSGWTIAGLVFVAGFCVVMKWNSDAGDAPSPEDQSLDLLASPASGEGPGPALVPPQVASAAPGNGWGPDRPWSGTSYGNAIRAVPRNLKTVVADGGPEGDINPPEPKLRGTSEKGPMAKLLASAAARGLVGAMMLGLAGGT